MQRSRMFLLVSFAAGSGLAAPAHADTQARAHTWSLSTSAEAVADYAAENGSRGAVTVAMNGLAQRDHLPFLGSTGGALWLAAGGDASGAGASHWSTLRVYGVEAIDDTLNVSFFPMDVRHRLDWHGRPTLASPRVLWRRPYTRVSGGVTVQMLGFATPGWNIGFFGLGFDAAYVRQDDGVRTAEQSQIDSAFSLFHLNGERAQGPDFALDLLAATMGAVHDGSRSIDDAWSSLGSFDFLRIQGMHLGSTVFAGFSIGVAGTGVLRMGPPPEDELAMPAPMPEEMLPLASTTTVSGRVEGSRGAVTAALAAHRDAYLTFDHAPALEHRVASELSWAGRKHAVDLTAFAAHTEVWADLATSESDITGGVSGSLQRQLDQDWRLDLSVEVARSFYASLAGAAVPEAELGARATAQLSRQFGTGP